MARFLEDMATSAPYSHESTQASSQPTRTISPHSHPEDHNPAQPVASRGEYQDHSLSDKIQMALTAQARGPSYVSKNSRLWGYATQVAKQTISIGKRPCRTSWHWQVARWCHGCTMFRKR